jgi:hypothetical protein
VDAAHGRRGETTGADRSGSDERAVEGVEVAGLQLRQRHRADGRQQVAVDEAAGLLHRLRREADRGVLEPASSSSPTVALVRTTRPRSASLTIALRVR